MTKICSKALILVVAFLCFGASYAQSPAQKAKMILENDNDRLLEIKERLAQARKTANEQARAAAIIQGWPLSYTFNNGQGFAELVKIGPNGKPIYFQTDNVDAAVSTRTDHLNSGGSLGLNLDGQSMTAHVWDGGSVRTTHQEFDGPGGTNRVTQSDGATSLSDHATHVTGTILAAGIAAQAKGMASYAQGRTFDWNSDLSEMASEAANGMLVSNHSYGYGWRNQFGQVQLPAYYGGGYIPEARDVDEIMYNAPYYLMFQSAGNDGDDNTANSNPLDGNSNYDKLTDYSCAKNNVVVAATEDVSVNPDGTISGSVSITSFSSEGPTDDYRIKPDIAGNGRGLYSSFSSGNTAYGTYSGTSMSTPNVTGSALLLQQHYNNINSSYMRNSTLKGLILHTADDAGSNGPDAIFGWGLMNTKAAAEVISAEGNTSIIDEVTLNNGGSYQITVSAAGGPLLASICWTDPAGTANTGTANLSTPVLVNDLDIRVTQGGSTYFPWALTGVTTNGQQDNVVDPYERVDIANGSGSYTITITHKGSLASAQTFSLIVTGVTGCELAAPASLSASNIGDNGFDLSWNAVSGANGYTVSIDGNNTPVSGTSYTASGLVAGTNYAVSVRANCASGGSGSASNINVNTTGVTPLSCTGTVSSFPYGESFESSDGWTQLGGDDGDWVRYTGSTPSSGTGPTSATDGTFYMYLEASTNNTPGQIGNNATASLGSPCYDLGGASTAEFSFQYHMNGTNVGSLVLEATSDDQTWTSLWSLSGSQGSAWNGATVNLDAYTGGLVKLRLVGTTGNGWSSDMAIDDLSLTTTTSGGGDTQAPSIPTSLAASNVTSNSFDVSWSASTDNVGVTGYTVYLDGVSQGTTTSTSYSFSGLNASTSYDVTIDAFDAAGNSSAQSSALSVTTSAAPDTQDPTVPSGLSASNIAQTSFDVSWNASSDNVGVAGYTVYLGGVSQGTTTGTSYSFSGLTAATNYSVTVDAFDAAGNTSAQSSALSVTTLSGGGGSSTVISANFFETGWQDWNDGGSDASRINNSSNAYEGSYSLRIRDNTNSSVITTDPFNLTGYSSIEVEFYFRPVGMENGEDFWLQYNDGSGFSTVAVWTVDGSNISNNTFYTSTVTLSSGDYSFVNGGTFRFRNDASINNDRIYIDAVTITGFTGTGPTATSLSTHSMGFSPSFQTEDYEEEELTLRLYPNPAHQAINLGLDQQIEEVKVFNTAGQLMIRKTRNTEKLDVSKLTDGLYIITVLTEDGTVLHSKFLKN